jgi:Flp pilus assembly protein TadD
VALDATNIDTLTVEGTLLTADGALDAATAAFERVRGGADILPTHVGSWHVLGWTYLLSGDLASAESAFQRALELNRNFAETHGSLAAIAALGGDSATAQRYMEVAHRLDPMSLSAQFTKAVLTGRGGDDEKARRMVLKALSRLTVSPGMAAAAGLSGTRAPH